jgi:hypothetical protein
MAEFEALTVIRNVLRAPKNLRKPGMRPNDLDEDLNSVSANSAASRHDHHNIEVKTVSEIGNSPSVVETDLYLFIPRNFEIASFGKAELTKDFRSRIRLALPVSGEQGANAFGVALKHLQLCLRALEQADPQGREAIDLGHPLCEDVLEATKDLCSVIAETLKHGTADHCRQFFMSHTLMTTLPASLSGLETLGRKVGAMHELMVQTRKVTSTSLQAPAAFFHFFDEYISQIYVQYLSIVRRELAKIGPPREEINTSEYAEARAQLELLLDSFQEQEARHRLKYGLGRLPENETELDRERRLLRLSHLKKFFQSKSFIDVSRKQSAKKIGESTAAAGTAIAALIAAVIERFSHSGTGGDLAFSGVSLLGFGVIIYVLRDRMKDWAKARFQEKALKFLPDYEQQLIAGDDKIGCVKEWFRLLPSKELPVDVHALRKAASASEMERRLPEDVFYCRKIQEVNASNLTAHDRTPVSRALLENTRINFERYLKHMDDPFKDLTDLDPSGRFLLSRSHRVYHFYLCVRTRTRPMESAWAKRLGVLSRKTRQAPKKPKEQVLLYRVVLDKNGVVRLEDQAL